MKYTNIKQENLITVLQSDKAIIQSDLDNLTQTSKNQAQQNTLLIDEINTLSLEYMQANKAKKILSARLAEQLKQFEKLKESDTDAKNWSHSPLPSSIVSLLNKTSNQDSNGH